MKMGFLIVVFRIFPLYLGAPLPISDSIHRDSPFEIEIVRVVSLSKTEITEITRFKNNKNPIFSAVLP